jgi:hypothetical protein
MKMLKLQSVIILFMLISQGCSPTEVKIMEDIVEGEFKVAETVMQDETGIPRSK